MLESEYKLWLYNIAYLKFLFTSRFSYRGYHGACEVSHFSVCDHGDIETERNHGKHLRPVDFFLLT